MDNLQRKQNEMYNAKLKQNQERFVPAEERSYMRNGGDVRTTEITNLIKQWYPFTAKPWRNHNGGVWKIGYGHARTVRPLMEIKEYEAEKLLSEDIASIVFNLSNIFPYDLTQNQFQALIGLTYLTSVAYVKNSSIKKYLKLDWQTAIPVIIQRFKLNQSIKDDLCLLWNNKIYVKDNLNG